MTTEGHVSRAIGVEASSRPAPEAFSRYVDPGRQGLIRRYFATWRHVVALVIGGVAAFLRSLPSRERNRPFVVLLRAWFGIAQLPLDRELRRLPFPVQLRRRFEILGPTYVKLGQALSMREDLLPRAITDELKKLLDHLPAVPFPDFLAIVSKELGRPAEDVFVHIDPTPLASGSIGQTHLATTKDGDRVVLKVVKPGVRAALRRDGLILRGLGAALQPFLGRYQPRRVLADFCAGTLAEADLELEAENAQMFAASFAGQRDIVFPKIFREYSTHRLLCMEYLDGIKPTDVRAKALPVEDRERLVDLGAEAIVCMLYRDGFFHADLHPANVLILRGPKIGLVDLARAGRFDARLRRGLLFYFHALIAGDAEGAANYLASLAEMTPNSDPTAFRRDVEQLCRHWPQRMSAGRASLARLIMDSIARAGRHRMYFPVELVLMVRAIVTFEAVGRMLVADFDVAAVCRRPVQRLMLQRFGPLRLVQGSAQSYPEIVDAIARAPRLIGDALQFVEQTRRPAPNPFIALRYTLFGGACVIAGALLAGMHAPWYGWVPLMALGLILAMRRGA